MNRTPAPRVLSAAGPLPRARRLAVALAFIALHPPVAQAQTPAAQAPSTREMNLIGWQEFAEMVPGRIETVLIPVGTLEPHGVIPNGADNLAPEAMARELAPRLDALIAPTLNYGVTGALDAFPGTFSIREEVYAEIVRDILRGLADGGFVNLIILNGHGGPQTAILERIAAEVGRERRVRTLVTNWWAATSEVVFEVFGENGGHAGNNETAYVQAIAPEHVHPERYDAAMASARVPGLSPWPSPSSIVLYEAGQGYPTFDAEQARRYFEAVNLRMEELIATTIERWDAARLFR
ncbi:MAG: creatininase family protein [Longimicrobiales bacterium]|nr:creatininase family protein [Longimicrobiales bacterium]